MFVRYIVITNINIRTVVYGNNIVYIPNSILCR